MNNNQEFWNELLQTNNKCADCNSREGLEWAVINFGVIVCNKCANIHKNYLDQISILRSTQEALSAVEQQYIQDMGNTKANQLLEVNVYRTEYSKPPPQATDDVRKDYIIAKYERTFCNDNTFPQLELDKRNTIPIPNKSLPTPPPKPVKAAPAIPPKSTKPQLSGTSPHYPTGQSQPTPTPSNPEHSPPPVPKKPPVGGVNLMGAPPTRPVPAVKGTSSPLNQSQEQPATPSKVLPPTPSNPPPASPRPNPSAPPPVSPRPNASSNPNAPPVSSRPTQPLPASPRPNASSTPSQPAKTEASTSNPPPPTSAPPPRPIAQSNGSQTAPPDRSRAPTVGTEAPPKRAPPKPPGKPVPTAEDPVAPEPPAPTREKSPFDKVLNDPHNKYCADCGCEAAYASFGLGIFLCSECACIHQNIGIPSQQASLVDPDSWDPQVLEFLLIMGNKRANEIWEWDYAEELSPIKKPTPLSNEDARYTWIKVKYLERRFADPFYVNKESSDTALQSQSNQFTKESYLSKLGNGVIPWSRKWFVLKDNYLFYYTSKEDMTPLGAIPLLGAQICVSAASAPSAPKNQTLRKLNSILDSSPQETDATFEINTPKRLYVLKADSFPEMNDWIVILSQNVDFLKSAPKRAVRASARASILNLNTMVSKQGVLFKFGEKNLTYKKRWFILQGHSLYYFKNRTDESPAGKISVRGATVKIVAARFGQKHTFQIYTPDEVFNLSADTSGIMNDWVDAVHDVIQNSFEEAEANGKEAPVTPAQPPLNLDQSILEGYLHKTGEIKKGFLDWKKRWCILKGNGSLYYFVNKGDKVPVGSINVLTTKFIDVPSSNKKFYFDLQTPHRTYHFYGDAPGDVVAWRNAVGKIQNAIHGL